MASERRRERGYKTIQSSRFLKRISISELQSLLKGRNISLNDTRKNDTPENVAPKNGTPQNDTSNNDTPNNATPKNNTPNNNASKSDRTSR